jgi:hypothetical protein
LVHAVSALMEDQESWPVLTDFDRLSLAFDMLEDEDIVARQHFTCCGTCGAAEIGIEMDDFRDMAGREPTGYVFFHQQDTESAVESGSLYISYGAADATASPEENIAIGQRLARYPSVRRSEACLGRQAQPPRGACDRLEAPLGRRHAQADEALVLLTPIALHGLPD